MNNAHEAESDVQRTQFSLTFSLDRDNFVRRTCPRCGRDFKTETSAADLAAALQPYFREAGIEIGAREEEETDAGKAYLRCPYCGYHAEASDMLTEDLITYTKRLIFREYLQPKLNKELAAIADSFGRGSRNSLVSVTFQHDPSVRAVRPIAGPEPPDMTIVHMHCCNQRIKIGGWFDLRQCPYCDTQVQIQH